MPSRHRRHDPLHRRIVGIAHGHRAGIRVPEEERLVAEVLLDAVIAIEVIGREVEQRADLRLDVGTVVQLERRELECHPRRRGSLRATSHSGRPMLPAATASSPIAVMRWATSDVVVVFPLVPVSAANRVTGSAVNPRSTSARIGRPASTAARMGGASGGTPGATTTVPARRDAPEVVHAQLHLRARGPQRPGPSPCRLAVPDLRRIDGDRVVAQQQARRHATLAQPDDGRLPAVLAELVEQAHRSLRVERASSAQKMPRM